MSVAIDQLSQINGLGNSLHLLSHEQNEAVRSLESAVRANDPALFEASGDYLYDGIFVNFLIARDWNVDKALKMLNQALKWRIKRPCHRWILEPGGPREALFKECAATGKIRVSGSDCHGRAVMVFDNSRENTLDPDVMVDFLAWNMELCRRTSFLDGQKADKLILLMHMTGNREPTLPFPTHGCDVASSQTMFLFFIRLKTASCLIHVIPTPAQTSRY